MIDSKIKVSSGIIILYLNNLKMPLRGSLFEINYCSTALLYNEFHIL